VLITQKGVTERMLLPLEVRTLNQKMREHKLIYVVNWQGALKQKKSVLTRARCIT
jgi:hypothetical protein